MKTSVLTSAIFATSLAFTGISWAETTNTESQKTPASATKAEAKKQELLKSGDFVQAFQNDNLSVEFKYDDGELKLMKLTNMAKTPMTIHVLQNTYILGKNDSVYIDPPSIKYINIRKTHHHMEQTSVSKALPNRFSDSHLYELPKQNGNKIDKALDQ